jgi:hypothetical protein
MQKSSSLFAVCLLVVLTFSIPRTQHLAPPEAPPPASSSDILIVEQPAQTDERDDILLEEWNVQP